MIHPERLRSNVRQIQWLLYAQLQDTSRKYAVTGGRVIQTSIETVGVDGLVLYPRPECRKNLPAFQSIQISLGYNTIQKIINRHPYLTTGSKRYRSKSRKYKIARVKAAWNLKDRSLGSLVQVDTKHLYILGTRFYVFAAVDCKSRYAYTYAYTTISSKSARDFLTRARAYFPFPLEAINTDNGSEYLLYFHSLTLEMDIPHYFSRPHTPTMNSRVERLIQTLEYEFLAYQELTPEITRVRQLCERFNTKYNQERYHRALNYQTPGQYVTTYQEKGVQPFSI